VVQMVGYCITNLQVVGLNLFIALAVGYFIMLCPQNSLGLGSKPFVPDKTSTDPLIHPLTVSRLGSGKPGISLNRKQIAIHLSVSMSSCHILANPIVKTTFAAPLLFSEVSFVNMPVTRKGRVYLFVSYPICHFPSIFPTIM